jgi:NAD-dependent DNA ligase
MNPTLEPVTTGLLPTVTRERVRALLDKRAAKVSKS